MLCVFASCLLHRVNGVLTYQNLLRYFCGETNKDVTDKGTNLRRFGGHFDARLEDGDGELGVGTAAEPETEVRVRRRILGLKVFNVLVQLRHPTQRQVTIGQKHPVTLQRSATSGQKVRLRNLSQGYGRHLPYAITHNYPATLNHLLHRVLKNSIALYRKPIAGLWSVTRHTGSHTIICHL